MTRGYVVLKRVIDVAVAAALLVASSPVLAAAAVAIWLHDRGSVLYRAVRVGKDGVPFVMFKFRTMVVDAERLGGDSTAADDPRLTPIGIRLRRWKLDELPQFLNVLRGDMSLVGPRPQVAADVAKYTDDERRLLTVLPGITDWSSIRFRNEAEILAGHPDPDFAYDTLIRDDKIRLGLLYVDSRSLRVDLRILCDTVVAVFGGDPTVPATGDDGLVTPT